jgi:hypothetical protein
MRLCRRVMFRPAVLRRSRLRYSTRMYTRADGGRASAKFAACVVSGACRDGERPYSCRVPPGIGLSRSGIVMRRGYAPFFLRMRQNVFARPAL